MESRTQNGTIEGFNGRMRDEGPNSALGYATHAAYEAGVRLATTRSLATVGRILTDQPE